MPSKHRQLSLGIVLMLAAVGFIVLLLLGDGNTADTGGASVPPPSARQDRAADKDESSSNAGEGVASPVDLTLYSRYAFITAKDSSKLAVLDTYHNKIVKHIDLKTTPQLLAISRDANALWYAKRGEKQVYRLDLAGLSQSDVSVAIAIDALSAAVNGRYLALAGEQGSVLYDVKTGQSTTLPTRGQTEFLFLSDQTLLAAELQHGKLTRIDLHNGHSEVLFDLKQPMSKISVMPNLMAFFFTANSRLYRYGLLDDVISNYEFNTITERPYITSESRALLVLAKRDNEALELLKINAYTLKVMQRYSLPKLATAQEKIMTGWLEQVAVVAVNNALQSLDLNGEATQQIPLSSDVYDMLVQADSKTLLATLDNSDKLLVFSLRDQKIIAEVPTQLAQPQQVLMGQTNTVCH